MWANDQNRTARPPTPEPAPAEAAPRDEHIAPAPRVSVQAFCETVETAAAIQSAGEDRRLGKAHRQDPDGRHHRRDRSLSRLADAQRHHAGDRTAAATSILTGLDALAEVCDAGTRVVVIGRTNDVTLYRELVRRGVSDYMIAPVGTHRRGALDLRPVLRARRQAGRPHHRRGRRQGRRRRLDRRPQHRLGGGARPRARHRRHRSRSRLRHRRPRLQPGPAAGHRRRGVLARPHRHRLRRPPAVEMHRSSEPAGGAGDARARLRLRRRGVRRASSMRCAPPCPASCSTCRTSGTAGPSARWSAPTTS